ncbi:alpha/beta hydrolase [Tomitella fengzijianii]|uniref:Lysophospholipase n=1 Tax=Tomitella fengzijianii TaxID=2597660 RepID=A0A516X070_9ACTN|nr:alpha/beta hydrolase [Tomitella fengzijianii]QDQ96021.1 lysophospholipase [Tomitella fengzijianii]
MERTHVVSAVDGLTLQAYRWPAEKPKATVQLAHGLAEHAQRYDRLARVLVAAGYDVWAHDHRGHGSSVSDAVPHGGFGEAGWAGLVADLVQVSGMIADAVPGVPHFLVGHSMGSFASQFVLLDHSADYVGVALSGTTALDIAAAAMPEPGSEAAEDANLDAYNAGFEGDTGYEWLSRDADEVAKYVADPLCGFDVRPDLLPGIFGASVLTGDQEVLAKISPDVAILVLSGEDDPLAGKGYMPTTVADRYRAAGVKDVELEIYPGARHEIFNETNRDEVTTRLIGWLDAHV